MPVSGLSYGIDGVVEQFSEAFTVLLFRSGPGCSKDG